MDDVELYRERILRHVSPVITGRFAGYQTSYTREVKVGQPLLILLYLTASIGRLVAGLIRMSGPSRRWRDLKKGPEFLVTPVRLQDDLGQVYEVEMHGHLPQSALQRGDLVQVQTRPQADHQLPVKLTSAFNLTTMQPLAPRIPTQISHIGPALFLQAVFGVVLLSAIVALVVR